jgi:beta-lactamase class A
MIAVAALDLRTGRRDDRNAEAVMPAASTIKVLISAAFWTAAERAELDPALADLDLLMLAVSDNAATNVLIDVVGIARVNALAAALGLRSTRLRRRMTDTAAAARGQENTTSAADMVALLAALARPGPIPDRARRRVLAGLAQSHHTDIVPRFLPGAAQRVIASKQGELADVRHDVALIDEGDRRVAIAALSCPAAAAEGLARAAAAAYVRLDDSVAED